MTAFPRLLWITPPEGDLMVVHHALETLPRALRCDLAILLRRPSVSGRVLWREGWALRARCATAKVPLLVHRRVDLALALDAAGVHLPERGLPIADVRALIGQRLIGVSRHDRAGLESAAAAGADYATLSPFGAVASKAPPLGPQGFAKARQGVPLPVLALGDIDFASADAAMIAGADGLAFIRSVLEDPARCLTALQRAIQAAAIHSPRA